MEDKYKLKSTTAKNLAKNAGKFSFGIIISRFLGLLREVLYAFFFGASYDLDVFRTAYIIPGLILEFISEGTMNAAFIPVLSDIQKNKSKKQAMNFALNLFYILILFSSVLTAIGIIFAPKIVSIIASGYSPDKQKAVVDLVRIIFPILIVSSSISLVMGILNYYRKYSITGIASAIWNAGAILSTIIIFNIAKLNGFSTIYSLALGILIGSVIELLFMMPALHKAGFQFKLFINFKSPAIQKVLLLFLPIAVGYIATRINVAVNQSVATHLSDGINDGAVSHYSYAFRLMSFPLGIIGVSLATVALPEAVRYASSLRIDLIKPVLIRSLRLALFFVLPVCTLMWILKFNIVKTIFQHGAFDDAATIATGNILGWFLIGIIGASFTKIIANIFFSLKDTKTPVIVSFISSIINIICVFSLKNFLGIEGLALSVSIASISGGILLILFFHIKYISLPFSKLFEGFFKTFLASLLPALLILLFLKFFSLNNALNLNFLQNILLILIVTIIYIPLYLIVARLLKFKVTKKN